METDDIVSTTTTEHEVVLNAVDINNDRGGPTGRLALRAQKKLLSKLGHRGFAKFFANDTGLKLLDILHEILTSYLCKHTADMTIENILKLTIKLGTVIKDDNLDVNQTHVLISVQVQLRSVILTILSFNRVAYSYEKVFLQRQLTMCHERLRTFIRLVLSENSLRRIDQVFQILRQERLLDEIFKRGGRYNESLPEIITNLEKIMDHSADE